MFTVSSSNFASRRSSQKVGTIAFRIAILAQPDSWYFKDLQRAAKPDESLVLASYKDLCVELFDNTILSPNRRCSTPTSSLRDFDAILVRSMPLGSLEQVIFRVNVLHAAQAAGVQVLNRPRTLEIAIDKWLTLATVAKQQIDTPRTIVCQNREQALDAFEKLNGDVVVKPIFGGEGRGIMRVSCADMAWRVFGTLEVNQSVIYLQEFVPHHDYDLRLFVIGRDVYAMKRINTNDWRTNVARGGITEVYSPSSIEVELALRSAEALGGGILGIDLLPTQDGRLLLLEVNAVPGWKALARTLKIDISRKVLDYIRDCS